MRILKVKGFGKNYFSLASIQAYSSEVGLLAKKMQTKKNLTFIYKISEDKKDEDAPPLETSILQNLLLESSKSYPQIEIKKIEYIYNDLSPPKKY